MEGKLIALEGIDGCGKSTQAKLLAEWLRSDGYEVKVTDEPTNGPLGKILKRAVRDEISLNTEAEALLFAGDRSIHVAEEIEPAMEAGKIVITERYIHSSLAYQTARGVSAEWIKAINEPAIEPDLAVLIDVPAEIGMERMSSSRQLDSFERDLELQKRVREEYRKLAKAEEMELVDGTREIDQTQDEIRKLAKQALHADPST